MLGKIKNLRHWGKSLYANIYFRFPSREITMIGVTGTDGKTTTALMISHILRKQGMKVGYITTVGFDIGDGKRIQGFHVTTPEGFELQKKVRKAVSSGLDYLVVEVSSHGLDQHRVLGCKFEVSVVTNVTSEHLDYHRTFQNYMLTKLKLLKMSKVAVINKDDVSFKLYENSLKNFKSFSKKGKADFSLKGTRIKLNIAGDYNKTNALAAVAVCNELGIVPVKSVGHLRSFKSPPGRAEIVQERPFRVVVDFAHTPNGLDSFLSEIKLSKGGRLIHVFGSAGERDYQKRPLMGEVASKYDDVIILTAEDPRSENVEDINAEIKNGIKRFNGSVMEIVDRATAINQAISMARHNDVVVVTGKGVEQSMNIGGNELSWDEIGVVKDFLKGKRSGVL